MLTLKAPSGTLYAAPTTICGMTLAASETFNYGYTTALTNCAQAVVPNTYAVTIGPQASASFTSVNYSISFWDGAGNGILAVNTPVLSAYQTYPGTNTDYL